MLNLSEILQVLEYLRKDEAGKPRSPLKCSGASPRTSPFDLLYYPEIHIGPEKAGKARERGRSGEAGASAEMDFEIPVGLGHSTDGFEDFRARRHEGDLGRVQTDRGVEEGRHFALAARFYGIMTDAKFLPNSPARSMPGGSCSSCRPMGVSLTSEARCPYPPIGRHRFPSAAFAPRMRSTGCCLRAGLLHESVQRRYQLLSREVRRGEHGYPPWITRHCRIPDMQDRH